MGKIYIYGNFASILDLNRKQQAAVAWVTSPKLAWPESQDLGKRLIIINYCTKNYFKFRNRTDSRVWSFVEWLGLEPGLGRLKLGNKPHIELGQLAPHLAWVTSPTLAWPES